MVHLRKFNSPDSKYGIHPFWFWNGEMEEEEIEHQIAEMADKGVTGFFLCARQGMSVPYLSDQWFQKVDYAIEVAANYNVDVWLYDEYPYPSGMAGGEVTLEHADAKQYSLIHHVEKLNSGETGKFEMPWARVLSAKAVPVHPETEALDWDEAIDVKEFIGNIQVEPVYQKTGLTAYNQKRYFTYKPKKVLHWTAPEGQWEIHCFLEQEIDDFKYYGTFVDPCHEEAMFTFIRTTHDRYAEKVGKYFGKTVKGMFTDEIHLLGRFPWSPKLVPFIQENYGYDIRDYIHLLLHHDNNSSAKVRYHYYQAIHLLTRKSYHKQVHDWCEQYSLDYVAEVPSVRMSAQLYSHVPGGDSAHEKLGRSLDWVLRKYFYSFRANPKMTSALSNQLGRERALIECFHSVGWSMTLQDAKWMIDRMAALGINFFNFHAFFYTLDAMVKHDAPPSHFLQNPYWKHFRKLGDYTARISYVMSEGTPVRPIAVLDPTTSLWTHMGNPYNRFTYTGENSEEEKKLELLKEHWGDICLHLTTHYKDYDHLDPEILEKAEIMDGEIRIGKTAYSVLILPPITNLECDAWKVIKQFINEGGTVIANGLLPYENIDDESTIEDIRTTFGLDDQYSSEFWEVSRDKEPVPVSQNAYFIPTTVNQPLSERIEALAAILDEELQQDIAFKVDDDSKSFLMQHRKLEDDSEAVFLSNQEGDTHQASLYVKKAEQRVKFTRLNLETGDSEKIEAVIDGDFWRIDLEFAAYQSHLIQIEKAAHKNESNSNNDAEQLEIDASHQWEMTPLQENMLRFDTFELQIESKGEASGTVQTKTFIDQCEDLANNHRLPIEFTQTFGTPMKVNLAYPIDVNYQTTFFIDRLPAHCSLVMDRHAIAGDFDILLNGVVVDRSTFVQKFVYDHNNVVADVHSLLKHGENTLKVKGKVDHDWEGVVDPLYLMGDFGVEFDTELQSIMTDVPTNATSLIGPYKGLPFYAGTISFQTNVHFDVPYTEEFTLAVKELEDVHECAEVLINGKSLGVKAWSPYKWQGMTEMLSDGENVVEVKITNTLIGLMEGKYFNYENHTLEDVRAQRQLQKYTSVHVE
ncbi:glycosyl hydrolase [Aquibacillus albus]|uniref:Glycoside hydrolase n=1 Tax=Aquibacillus albus TaxID=1168171 RepID=A0ABS2N6F0_9BACI|nr:glycosyl hydrolase [Aquibacillus albus]MBM7573465.1 hypothetical protein [Aquibacillus albus]